MVIAYDRASVIVLKIMTIVMVIRLLDHPWSLDIIIITIVIVNILTIVMVVRLVLDHPGLADTGVCGQKTSSGPQSDLATCLL